MVGVGDEGGGGLGVTSAESQQLYTAGGCLVPSLVVWLRRHLWQVCCLFPAGWTEGSHLDRCVPDPGDVPRAAGGYHCGVGQGGRFGARVGCGFPAWPYLWNRVSTPLPRLGFVVPDS